MNTVVIAVGSNIEPEKNVKLAKKFISKDLKLIKASQFIKTKALGITDQDDFLNGVLLIESRLNLMDLKQLLRKIEDKIGRVRKNNKSGPRCIDLDVVVWNGNIIDNDVYEREFLKNSLIEIMPELEKIF